ncbi:MAG: SIS domain-containing protein [bacterium]
MKKYLRDTAQVIACLADEPPAELRQFVEAAFVCWDNGGKIVSFGNGGSATDSLHFTTELVARFRKKPIHRPAISLAASPSSLTAIANDWSFEELFSRQVEAQVTENDLLLGISTSGNSPNVIHALKTGLQKNAVCFGLVGASGGEMAEIPGLKLIRVPSSITAHIQVGHIACLHAICDKIDLRING